MGVSGAWRQRRSPAGMQGLGSLHWVPSLSPQLWGSRSGLSEVGVITGWVRAQCGCLCEA